MATEGRVVVMARAPIAGQAKTRLIAALGADAAARLQARLTRRALSTAIAAEIGVVSLFCAPDAGHPFFRQCAEDFGVELANQHGSDLGQRMADAFRRLLPDGPVILIGSDCPALSAADLQAAWDALQFDDVVLTPAQDGGYVLIGLRRFAPRLFEEISWGSSAVLAQTRQRLVELSWRWDELPARWDVDRPEDVERLERERLIEVADLRPVHDGTARG